MVQRSKRFKQIEKSVDLERVYSVPEAIALLKQCPSVKFDQSLEISIKSTVDVKKSDQLVRGTVVLPHGLGKNVRVLVFARGDKKQAALDAGAAYAGAEEYLEEVKKGWADFDAVVSTPDMMRDVGRLGKILGPRGLMPSPRAGTVTMDVVTAVKELLAGRIEFKVDKNALINNALGKLSFSSENLSENVKTYFSAVMKAKPSTVKGVYLQAATLSSTMGPGVKISLQGLM